MTITIIYKRKKALKLLRILPRLHAFWHAQFFFIGNLSNIQIDINIYIKN